MIYIFNLSEINSMKPFFICLILLLFNLLSHSAIIINEIHHDPDIKTELVEFIELHNTGNQTVDLSGWTLENAINYIFPDDSFLASGSYIVISHQANQFKKKFGTEALGPWSGKLDNDGERIELRSSDGTVVERVR